MAEVIRAGWVLAAVGVFAGMIGLGYLLAAIVWDKLLHRC